MPSVFNGAQCKKAVLMMMRWMDADGIPHLRNNLKCKLCFFVDLVLDLQKLAYYFSNFHTN